MCCRMLRRHWSRQKGHGSGSRDCRTAARDCGVCSSGSRTQQSPVTRRTAVSIRRQASICWQAAPTVHECLLGLQGCADDAISQVSQAPAQEAMHSSRHMSHRTTHSSAELRGKPKRQASAPRAQLRCMGAPKRCLQPLLLLPVAWATQGSYASYSRRPVCTTPVMAMSLQIPLSHVSLTAL